MVQCAQCGVHLPLGEAIAYRGLHYCRRAHLPADSDPDSPAA
ncbi:PP0621 family protein [Cupriavidus basilensis]